MPTLPAPGGPLSRSGFGSRLLIGQTLVVVAGALTTWVLASAVGPGIFHDHLQRAGVGHTPAETEHVEEAFASALFVSLSVALLAAVVAALGVSGTSADESNARSRP